MSENDYESYKFASQIYTRERAEGDLSKSIKQRTNQPSIIVHCRFGC